MPKNKKAEKLTTKEQLLLFIPAVITFMLLKNILELSFGITGIFVWAVTGAIGGIVGWLVLKFFRKLKEK